MSDHELIPAVQSGDVEEVKRRLAAGADVDERDDQGWTPLNWAAGRGDAAMVEALLEGGADVTLTGRDLRTPLAIAKAAGRDEVAELLTAAEKERGVWEDPASTRPYCRAYPLQELRGFAAFEVGGDGGGELADDDVVYLHQDFTVTRSMWHGEEVLFADVDEAWKSFCRDELEFAIPADLL